VENRFLQQIQFSLEFIKQTQMKNLKNKPLFMKHILAHIDMGLVLKKAMHNNER